ncbi:MAG TPA: hypothetical protein VJ396_10365 [Acidiferrobacterales bacterium]|nr:hypothetical protein [Acidiferrobacterales bacterium]
MRAPTPLSALVSKSTRLSVILGLTVASGLASALMASRPSHAEDDYVRSMRSEGQKLEQLDRRPATADEKNADIPIKDFEAALIQDSPDSYRIYQQLSSEKRQAVFKFYLEERNLKPVRRRIIDLRLGG